MYESEDKMVSHPDHYISETGMEVIDVIEAFTFDLKGIEATDTANIIKYDFYSNLDLYFAGIYLFVCSDFQNLQMHRTLCLSQRIHKIGRGKNSCQRPE